MFLTTARTWPKSVELENETTKTATLEERHSAVYFFRIYKNKSKSVYAMLDLRLMSNICSNDKWDHSDKLRGKTTYYRCGITAFFVASHVLRHSCHIRFSVTQHTYSHWLWSWDLNMPSDDEDRLWFFLLKEFLAWNISATLQLPAKRNDQCWFPN